MFEYMVRTLIPNCFLVKPRAAGTGLSGRLVSRFGRLRGPGVLEREFEAGLGVREAADAGK
jgi:hypothetical protein